MSRPPEKEHVSPEPKTNRSGFPEPAPPIRFRIHNEEFLRHVLNGKNTSGWLCGRRSWAQGAPLVGKYCRRGRALQKRRGDGVDRRAGVREAEVQGRSKT